MLPVSEQQTQKNIILTHAQIMEICKKKEIPIKKNKKQHNPLIKNNPYSILQDETC
jgi:hypothetical protein